MPYIKNANAIDFLYNCNSNELNEFSNRILFYLHENIKTSQILDFDYENWIKKINELVKKINDIDIMKILCDLRIMSFKNKFYFGNYHGDFTLTNLLITSRHNVLNIFATDFLDSFIHSPINDIVKMRQDTYHNWTQTLMSNKKDIYAIKFIDKKIKDLIENDKILKEYYIPFQILNLIRILPYTTDEKIRKYLKKEIVKLHKRI
jgi:hypothetical protein